MTTRNKQRKLSILDERQSHQPYGQDYLLNQQEDCDYQYIVGSADKQKQAKDTSSYNKLGNSQQKHRERVADVQQHRIKVRNIEDIGNNVLSININGNKTTYADIDINRQELEVLNIEHNRIVDYLNELTTMLEDEYEQAVQLLTNNIKIYDMSAYHNDNASGDKTASKNKSKSKAKTKTQQSNYICYAPKYSINLALVHSIINSLQGSLKFVNLLKSYPTNKATKFYDDTYNCEGPQMDRQEQNRLSIYLIQEQYLLAGKDKQIFDQKYNIKDAEQSWNLQNFIDKNKYATEIELSKNTIANALYSEQALETVHQKCTNVLTLNLLSDQHDQRNQIQDIDISRFTIFQNISALNLKDSAITDSAIQMISQKMHHIKQLDISGCYMLTQRSIKLLTQCNLVTIFINSIGTFKESSVIQLIRNASNLNYLEIKGCAHISEDIFGKVYQVYRANASCLKWLQISSDYGIDLYINKLTYLTSENPVEQITDSQLNTLIGQNPPQYTGLYFQNCQQLTKLSIQLIMQKCKGLKRLALSKYINLTDRLVQDISLALIHLVFIDLNNCYNITDNAMYYIGNNLHIQYLGLEKCLSITDEGLINILGKTTNLVFNTTSRDTRNLGINVTRSRSRSKSRAKKPSFSLKKSNNQNSTLTVYHRPSSNKNELNPHQLQVNYKNNEQQSYYQTSFDDNTEQYLYMEQPKEVSQVKLKYLNISGCKKITDEALSYLGHQAHHLVYLNLSNCDQITDISIEIISQELLSLQYLNLNHCQGLTDSSISMIATRLSKKLKVLQLQWCQVSQNCIRLICENLTNLQILNVSYCPSVYSEQLQILSKNMTKLHTLKLQSCNKINEQAFIKLSSLRCLKIICLKECSQVTDLFIKLLTTNNKQVQHLDISWCVRLTDLALFYIAKNCYNLKHLNLNGCVQITDEGIQWLSTTVSKIQYLNLTLCSKLTDKSILQITKKLGHIKYLYLSQLQNLTDISIASISNLDKLQKLTLMGCTQITNSSLIGLLYNLQKLNQLNLNQCRSIDGNILSICEYMSNIKILQISQIQIQDDFILELTNYCPKLTYINLCYCNDVTDQAVLQMLEKLPKLERIDIQSTNIAERTKQVIFHALNSRRMANIVLQ